MQTKLTPSAEIPHNLPNSTTEKFVGRDKVLKQLHKQLQQHSTLAITAVRGMGGVGKTELARQYGLRHLRQKSYSGGICWLDARNQDIVSRLLSFARTSLGLQIPEDIKDTEAILNYCWNYWPKPAESNVLIILDDVTDYRKIQPYLPPAGSRFKVLITTRLQLNLPNSITLEVLEPGDALNLLQRWVKDIDAERPQAEELCQRLGYLPLALNLVGNYIQRQDISIVEMLSRLEEKGLKHPALEVDETDPCWTLGIKRGVQAAFELSWVELSAMAQQLAGQLSLFALAPIPWKLIEAIHLIPPEKSPPPQGLIDWLLQPILYLGRAIYRKMKKWLRKQPKATLEHAKVELERLHFLERVDPKNHQLHQLTREFFRNKLEENKFYSGIFKKSFVQLMVNISNQVSQQLTLTQMTEFEPIIPHWIEIVEHWVKWLKDNELIWLLMILGEFYNRQTLYSEAETWYEKYLEAGKDRLGKDNPYIAISLNNLAALYESTGRYQQAEPLYLKAIKIAVKILGEENHNTQFLRRNYHNFLKHVAMEGCQSKLSEVGLQVLSEIE